MILSSFLLALALCPQVGALPAGQPPRDAAPRPEATGSGIIRGHVIAADTGTPVRRANVTLSMTQSQASMTGRGQVNSGSMSSRQTTADAQGAFEFPEPASRELPGLCLAGSVFLRSISGSRTGRSIIPGNQGHQLIPRQVRSSIARRSGCPAAPSSWGASPTRWAIRSRARKSGIGGSPPGARAGQRNSPGVQTDDLGQFRLYGLLSGEYVVSVEARSPTFVPPNMPQQRE